VPQGAAHRRTIGIGNADASYRDPPANRRPVNDPPAAGQTGQPGRVYLRATSRTVASVLDVSGPAEVHVGTVTKAPTSWT